MTLRLYNSATRQSQDFAPADPDHIGLYACGPTVYDRAHLGNARMVVVFDLLYRTLLREFPQSRVTYVRNITDIDDKIIAAAAANGESIEALTARMTDHFHADMAALNCLPPAVEPRATDHIPQMIAMIERLIESGHAYEAEGHVLFAVTSDDSYGALSGRSRDEQIAGARVDIAPYKRDPADFVLWKPSPPDYPGWDSPWGRGRPGWHIECSAMSAAHLGQQFDIHGGGIDLIFPHHENEVAQSLCANGMNPARLWMHNGHLVVAGQKMSKSLGNFTTVEDLLKKWHGEVIRWALLSSRYPDPLDMTGKLLEDSKKQLDYLYDALRRNPESGSGELSDAMADALRSDLNTPFALTALYALAKSRHAGETTKADLLASGQALGLLQSSPEDWFRWHPADADALSETDIATQIEARRQARAARDFAGADRIRNELLAQGVGLEDGAGGTTWKRI